MIDTLPKTIFCDIDGTLLEYPNRDLFHQIDPNVIPKILPGVREKLLEWLKKDYNIILTTGRKESARLVTEQQLRLLEIPYDQLIMGIGGGQRVVINDKKPDSNIEMAIGITINRNEGLSGVKI